MPSYIGRSHSLRNSGPLIRMQLWVPQAATNESGIIIPPLNVVALVDTGAYGTLIQEGVATALRLSPVGTTKIQTPTKLYYECQQYRIRLLFPQKRSFDVVVAEAPFLGYPVQCLIGRDILKHSLLMYNGMTNMFSLIF